MASSMQGYEIFGLKKDVVRVARWQDPFDCISVYGRRSRSGMHGSAHGVTVCMTVCMTVCITLCMMLA
eukprot:365125-Chlamydomonas_euryale.AAC.10